MPGVVLPEMRGGYAGIPNARMRQRESGGERGSGKVARQSAFLKRLQEQKRKEQRNRDMVVIQECQDMACIALNDAFGFGPDRLKKFCEAFMRTWTDYATLTVEDARADSEVTYSVAKFEERLKQVCGEYYAPRDLRYGRR